MDWSTYRDQLHDVFARAYSEATGRMPHLPAQAQRPPVDKGDYDVDWFIDVYAREVLRPLGGWYVTSDRKVRRPHTSPWGDSTRCPLTLQRDYPHIGYYREAGRYLGLSDAAADTLALLVDGHGQEVDPQGLLRERLEYALGIRRPGGAPETHA